MAWISLVTVKQWTKAEMTPGNKTVQNLQLPEKLKGIRKEVKLQTAWTYIWQNKACTMTPYSLCATKGQPVGNFEGVVLLILKNRAQLVEKDTKQPLVCGHNLTSIKTPASEPKTV